MSEKKVTIKKGQTETISLPGKALSGYQWKFNVENSDIVRVQQISASNETTRPGQGSDEMYELAGLKTGNTQITFMQMRPWEANVQPIATEVYDIEVE